MGWLDAYAASKIFGSDTVKKHAVRKMFGISGANVFDKAETKQEKAELLAKVAANEQLEKKYGFWGWLMRSK